LACPSPSHLGSLNYPGVSLQRRHAKVYLPRVPLVPTPHSGRVPSVRPCEIIYIYIRDPCVWAFPGLTCTLRHTVRSSNLGLQFASSFRPTHDACWGLVLVLSVFQHSQHILIVVPDAAGQCIGVEMELPYALWDNFRHGSHDNDFYWGGFRKWRCYVIYLTPQRGVGGDHRGKGVFIRRSPQSINGNENSK